MSDLTGTLKVKLFIAAIVIFVGGTVIGFSHGISERPLPNNRYKFNTNICHPDLSLYPNSNPIFRIPIEEEKDYTSREKRYTVEL